ncbi:hypothetical protein LCGC14_2613630, partial [marine sediment metagenome]
PCMIQGFKDYTDAKEDGEVTAREWSKVVERFTNCVLSKLDVPVGDKVKVEQLFNSAKYKIKLN